MTTVSAVIPCYNAAPWIGAALASVRAQSRPVDEVLVVDDGSTDGSAEIAAEHGARVLRTPRNLGAAGARNLALREARGELVAWLDADDYWAPEHCETVVGLLERWPEAVLAFARVRSFGAREEVWPLLLPPHEAVDAFTACLRRCILPQNAVVVRRAAVIEAGGYDERLRLAEDYDLWLRLAERAPFVCTDAVTAFWRRHEAQTSHDFVRYWAAEYESRANFLATHAADDPTRLREVERQMLQIWQEHLMAAWHSRNGAHYAFHLGMAARVPGAAAVLSHYRRRGRLMPLVRVADWARALRPRAARRPSAAPLGPAVAEEAARGP